jgi:hypothetical protein
MSDYNNPNPNNPNEFDNPIPGTARPFVYDEADRTSRAPYVLLGILVLIGIVGGALYFNSGHRTARDVAAAPPGGDRHPPGTDNHPGDPAGRPSQHDPGADRHAGPGWLDDDQPVAGTVSESPAAGRPAPGLFYLRIPRNLPMSMAGGFCATCPPPSCVGVPPSSGSEHQDRLIRVRRFR